MQRTDGVEHGQWGSPGYHRTCTPKEEALMVAATALEQSGKRAAQEADRTAYFAEVAADIAAATEANAGEPLRHPAVDPGSAWTPANKAGPGSGAAVTEG